MIRHSAIVLVIAIATAVAMVVAVFLSACTPAVRQEVKDDARVVLTRVVRCAVPAFQRFATCYQPTHDQACIMAGAMELVTCMTSPDPVPLDAGP